MNVLDYIESGILDAYAAGALLPEEEAQVEAVVAMYQEAREELENIREGMEMFAYIQRINPRPELRPIVLGRAAGTPPALRLLHLSERPIPQMDAAQQGGYPRRAFTYSMAAVLVLTLLSSMLAIYFEREWQSARSQLSAALSENQRIAQESVATRKTLDRAAGAIAAMKDPARRVVEMRGVKLFPSAIARVYWSPESQTVYLDRGSLPPTPSGKTYQLWAIADGKPVDAGLFAPDASGLILMKKIGRAEAFAVTLEPAGGSTAPTIDQMYVMGKI